MSDNSHGRAGWGSPCSNKWWSVLLILVFHLCCLGVCRYAFLLLLLLSVFGCATCGFRGRSHPVGWSHRAIPARSVCYMSTAASTAASWRRFARALAVVIHCSHAPRYCGDNLSVARCLRLKHFLTSGGRPADPKSNWSWIA
jgi:hypothetical protein